MDMFIITDILWILMILSKTQASDSGHRNLTTGNFDFDERTLLTTCQLRPVNEDIYKEVILTFVREAKLIEYRVVFEDYVVNPLEVNNTWSYKSHTWARTGSGHGQTILNLAFNYGILSLMTLSFGVVQMDVVMEDLPHGCLAKLSEAEKINVTLDIMLRDLKANGSYTVEEGRSVVCHQVIKEVSGYAKFTDRCCYRSPGLDATICDTDLPNRWLDILDILLSVLALVVFLFGPVMLPKWIYNVTLEKQQYVVKLKEPLYKTLAISRSEDCQSIFARHTVDLRNKKNFVNCRRIIGELPSNMIIPVKISQFDIFVNYRKMLQENHVPVSLTESIARALFLCKLRELDAFNDCCDANICVCSSKRRKPLRWISVCNFVGKIVLVFVLPIPYYIRLAVYYIFEDPEIQSRQAAAENVDLSVMYNHRIMQYLTPTHTIYLVSYILYYTVGITMACLSVLSVKTRFQQALVDSFGDVLDLSWLSAVGMMIKNCLWPFKKFGICGIFIGIIWWPLVIPVSLVACIIYCLPLVYLSARIAMHTCHSRPERFKTGVQKFEADTLLKELGSKNNLRRKKQNCYCTFSIVRFLSNLIFICLALSTIFAVLLMFTEVVSFVAEVLCFTFMGLIVNASKVLKYGTFIFLVVIYSYDTYNNVNKRYLKLNKALFSEIKGRLGCDIEDFTSLPAHLQGNRGFKTEEASDQADYEGTDDISNVNDYNWDINDLVLFIDKNDTPRIPKKLFDEVCEMKVPGSPGPVYRSLMHATGKFFMIVCFLVFIFIVVMCFGESYKMSSTNKMLATMAGGFAPFLFRYVLRPASADIETNLLSFRSKLSEIIKNFCQNWPMYDLILDIEEKPEDADVSVDAGSGTNDDEKCKEDAVKNDEKTVAETRKISTVMKNKVNKLFDNVDGSGVHTEDTNDNDFVHAWNVFLNSLKSKVEEMDLKSAEGQSVDILLLVQELDQEWLMELSSISDLRDYTPNGTINDSQV